ncbi:MAG: protein translocase subunit SecF [Proteobacteria bacterium]|nr:protein translocase subunit SecF [Pseudomonadota bacterium]
MNLYDRKYNFLKYKKSFMFISLIFFILSILLFYVKGLNLGVDFKGGTVIEMKFDQPNNSEEIRKSLLKIDLGDVKVKEFGSNKEFLATIEQKGKNNDFVNSIKIQLEKDLNIKIDFRRVEVVGSKVSKELTIDGIYSVIIALTLMLIYIWFRFEWQFSLGSIIALVHDVIITIGVFSLIGYEFNLSIVAAILTIVGYSMNDTVIIYDRIREFLRKDDKQDIIELINDSINSTLSRTLKTSGTTLLALISIYFFGGEILKGFSFALIWGIIIGTYSSIFIASPILIYFNVKRNWEEVVDNTP